MLFSVCAPVHHFWRQTSIKLQAGSTSQESMIPWLKSAATTHIWMHHGRAHLQQQASRIRDSKHRPATLEKQARATPRTAASMMARFLGEFLALPAPPPVPVRSENNTVLTATSCLGQGRGDGGCVVWIKGCGDPGKGCLHGPGRARHSRLPRCSRFQSFA